MSSKEEYLKMLAHAREKLPKILISGERFHPPDPEVVIEGGQTHIVNFREIGETLRRDLKLMATFLSKKLGTPYMITEKEKKLVLTGRVRPELIKPRLESFVNTYVICPVCHRPDTTLIRYKRSLILKCNACGAETPVPKI
jgi:translation initiation factor 2 subunit 2